MKARQIQPEVLVELEASRMFGRRLVLRPGLDRKLYLKVNEVLEAVGAKWDRKEKCHLFPADAAVAIENLILAGEIEIPKDFDFFETPFVLAQAMCAHVQLRQEHDVLEPSAGKGALVRAITPHRVRRLTCVELSKDRAIDLLETLEMAPSFHIVEGDFLKSHLTPTFDRVIMNPPFSKQQDIDHVRYAFTRLRPGGRLVSVMSAGVAFRQNRKTIAFREFVEANEGAIEPLPAGSFKASGTDVNTVLVSLRKDG